MSEHKEALVEIERLEHLLADVRAAAGGTRNAASITVNAGGVGVWLVSCMCCFMFGLNLLLFFVVIGQDRKIDDLSHYLNAIFQEAPHLKPKEK